MKREITLDNSRGRVRVIVFDKPDDPFVIAHEEPEMLSNGSLEELYAEWQNETGSQPAETEDFEQFLFWLEEKKGFVYLTVADEAYEFAS